MESCKLRRVVYLINFTVIVFVSVFFCSPQLGKITYVFRLLGFGLIFLGVSSAFYVHNLFPKHHERPTDFSKLLKEGHIDISGILSTLLSS